MTLTAGTRLGAYEIAALIGAGGMGEVYRARDTRLNRNVALKVLPELFASDPDRLARFKREAQLLASLNHPNIAAIYGLEETDGALALILELVEGPTIADRIAEGPIAVEEALAIARQIAEALEGAHERGVIHRDLKPANIKLRRDSTVKVLDFGLAKAFEGDMASPDVSQSPTLSVAATRMGVILGTAAYMAPEQAKARAVDKRADIWAFGCVLYEMLAGRPAFDGDDISEILASVIKGTTNLNLLPADLHPRLRELLARCLEKDVRKRFRDVGDVTYELERIQADPHGTLSPSATTAQHVSSRRLFALLGGTVVGTALVVGGAVWILKPAPPVEPRDSARFTVTLPEDQTLRATGRPMIAIAPDGRQLVYNTTSGVYLRTMDRLSARLIPGTAEGNMTNLFFSADGQWVGFWSDNQLKKIPVAGGTPVVLCEAANPFGASWGADNTILFGQPEGVMRVSANGGAPELLVGTKAGEGQVHGPQMLPGGEWVLFSIARGVGPDRWDTAEIAAQSLASGERKVLWRGGSDARYVPTGHLVYALGDALFAVPFDPDRVEVSGGPVPVMDQLMRVQVPGQNTGTAHYGISDRGTFVHIAGTFDTVQDRTLVWLDRAGREEAIPAPPRPYLTPRISPDGTQLALSVLDQDDDIWIWSLARQTLTRLTFDPGPDRGPVWTPDGRRIVFSSARGGRPNLFLQAADGTGTTERLTEGPYGQFANSISTDGTKVVFDEFGQVGIDVRMVTLDGERQAVSLVATTFREQSGDLSSDGRWMAYQSTESGRDEIYVRPFPNVDGGRWQVSSGGGTNPLWAPGSRELFYIDSERRIVAVPVEAGPRFSAGSPRIVADSSSAAMVPGFGARMYDVSPDGQRFLLVKPVEDAQHDARPPQIIVIQNWFEELRRLAPRN